MKEKITGISLQLMTNDESFEFHTSILDYYTECAFAKMSEAEKDYRIKIGKYDDALRQVRESEKTLAIARINTKRNKLYTNFVKTNRVMMMHYDEAIAGAAYSINIAIHNYKNPVKMSYAAATSVVYNLCQELQSPYYAPKLETAGLSGWIERLNEANESFERLFNERSEYKSTLVAGLTISSRQKMEDCYRKLMLISEAELLNEDCLLHNYVARINTQIAYYKKLIAARKTLNANKKAKKENKKNHADKNPDTEID